MRICCFQAAFVASRLLLKARHGIARLRIIAAQCKLCRLSSARAQACTTTKLLACGSCSRAAKCAPEVKVMNKTACVQASYVQAAEQSTETSTSWLKEIVDGCTP